MVYFWKNIFYRVLQLLFFICLLLLEQIFKKFFKRFNQVLDEVKIVMVHLRGHVDERFHGALRVEVYWMLQRDQPVCLAMQKKHRAPAILNQIDISKSLINNRRNEPSPPQKWFHRILNRGVRGHKQKGTRLPQGWEVTPRPTPHGPPKYYYIALLNPHYLV